VSGAVHGSSFLVAVAVEFNTSLEIISAGY